MSKIKRVQEGDFIVHDLGEAGQFFSWAPGEVLRVGIDIDVAGANVRLQPHDEHEPPRAHQISEEEALPLLASQRAFVEETQVIANEVPPPEDRPRPQEPDEEVEVRDAQPEIEKATAPQAEDRETAVPNRRRRRVKPPAKKEKDK